MSDFEAEASLTASHFQSFSTLSIDLCQSGIKLLLKGCGRPTSPIAVMCERPSCNRVNKMLGALFLLIY